MSKSNIGFPGALAAIAGIFTLGGLVSIGLLRKAVGTILIMLVGIYAISNIKGDFFSLIKDFSTRSEAADIRRLEFERERLKLEAETKLKVLEIETKRTEAERRAKEAERIRQEKQAAAEVARQESERIRQEKLAEDTVKKEAENKIAAAKNAVVNGGFKMLEKNSFREIHYKLLPVKWVNGNKVVPAETVLSRNELTTATSGSNAGMKWQSERLGLEFHCSTNLIRVTSSLVNYGPWNIGEVMQSFTRGADLPNPYEWQKNLATKACE
jgi:hypothetical protein